MKHVHRKLFWDYEKEEQWLNHMSSIGMVLTDYAWCRYVFTEGRSSEFTYRIELLQHMPTHPESIAYLRFMEQNGVEVVASQMRWVYFRRKSSEGAFDIYSDLESKISHFKRIHLLWTIVIVVQLTLGLVNISNGFINMNVVDERRSFEMWSLISGTFSLLFGLFLWRLRVPIKRKIKVLQQEKEIRE